LQRAIADQAALRARGLDWPISVNLSGRCLTDDDFFHFAADLVRTAGADICFEITETAVIGDPDKAIRSVEALRSAGASVSIDDFGAGFSSLAYLKQLAAQELKLDRSLVSGISSNSRDRLILSSTIQLAHSLGMSVVAEGVEDEITMAVLGSLRADCVQGYWIAKPMPLDAFADWLDEKRARRALQEAKIA
jgi:EAL domain-containing protein (putative c-di-GMP-specific phosphodiesterase class I)